jgi:tripartite-type tricarboxylate transporter receptor subunit TctC
MPVISFAVPGRLRRRLLCGAVAASLIGLSTAVGAQVPWPSKPITLVVGFPPGGSNDIVARIIAPSLGQLLGQPIVIENRPGANAILGTEYVARAAPDGYTLTLGSASPLAISPATYPKIPFDPIKDFVGITTIAATGELLAVHPSTGVKTLAELVALAKTREVTLSSSGNGGLPHLAIELLKNASKGRFVHVPYKGAGPAITDTMGGHVDGVVMDLPALLPGVRDGKLVALAAADRTRSSSLPDVPTSAEAGLPSFIALNWFAVMAPAHTPKPIVDRLYAALVRTVQLPEVAQRLRQGGIEPFVQESPEAFAGFFKDELVRWGGIARSAGAKVDQ